MSKQTTQKAEDMTELMTEAAEFLTSHDPREGATITVEAPPLQVGFQAYVGLVARQESKRYPRVYRENAIISTAEERNTLLLRWLANAMQWEHLSEKQAQESISEGRLGARLFIVPNELHWASSHVGRPSPVATHSIFGDVGRKRLFG
jgi:hypothetical protein